MSVELLVILAFFAVLATVVNRSVRPGRGPGSAAGPAPPQAAADDLEKRLEGAFLRADQAFRALSHPQDLLAAPAFQEGVQLLLERGDDDGRLLDYYTGDTIVMACMAVEALGRRSGTFTGLPRLLEGINEVHPYTAYFALRAMRGRCQEPVIGRLLLCAAEGWGRVPHLQYLREFVRARVEDGERATFGDGLGGLPREQAAVLRGLLARLSGDLPASLGEEFRLWEAGRLDLSLLRSVGSVLEPGDDVPAGDLVERSPLAGALDQAVHLLEGDHVLPVLLVGEPGSGTTAVLDVAGHRLLRAGWTVFRAGASDLIAGQIYAGSLEQRIRDLCEGLHDRLVLWTIPEFHALLWAGRHAQSPDRGVLDLLLPHLEAGRIRVIGETDPRGYERLVQLRPRMRTILRVVPIEPMGEEDTLELARRWLGRAGEGGSAVSVTDGCLRETLALARQYLPAHASPGNLVGLLERVLERRQTIAGAHGEAIEPPEVLATLSQMAGFPTNILDERAVLDVAELRRFFAGRVLGQPEAVDCLVERVAMIKAGLTDPRRPLGVFLFAGPSGTGKTELAKALSEYLFGSEERLIRFDMSEFQTPADLDRILGTGDRGSERDALVHAIRRQPFSVVLLDEIEKAHPSIWDLFLQVFDDGRLTDRHGNTADFRHSIVIMTSNLGARIVHGGRLGFDTGDAKRAADLDRLLDQTFRREFLNRIDRVVFFQVLGLGVMREILLREIRQVVDRRGLRTRSWAVEWDDSALDFLLERGFSPQFGARPLRRAIERYVLAPLALAIAERRAPEGDQFLFVRPADGRLEVEFVDPDAPEAEESMVPPDGGGGRDGRGLQAIALDGGGSGEEVATLRAAHGELGRVLADPDWATRKENALAQMAEPRFWSEPGRFAVLGLAEYLDRIEAGYRTASSLLERIAPHGARGRAPAALARRLAGHLFLLREACAGVREGKPRDAYVSLRASRGDGADRIANNDFARRLATMYRSWAERRGMSARILDEHDPEDGTYRLLLAVSGFAAYALLQHETGLHVLESPRETHGFARARAQVVVVPQPEAPPARRTDALRRQAVESLRGLAPDRLAIVRRYREGPAAFAQDLARGWRTGNLERVLSGDFDLLAALATSGGG